MSTDLLPPNAAPQERALSLATARAGEVRVDVDKLWNPSGCPASILPWLAWALHVDEWDGNWTETQKRQVIAASFAVHKVKGTAGAVKRMAESFGAGVLITEWWQTTPQGAPHTFTALFSIPTVSADTQTSIIDAIGSVKPARSAMTAQVVQNADLPVAVPAFARFATFDRFTATLA